VAQKKLRLKPLPLPTGPIAILPEPAIDNSLPAGNSNSGAATRTLQLLGIIALLVVATFGLRELSWLIAPIAFTMLLVTLLYPLFPRLLAWRVPKALAIALMVIATYLSLALLMLLVIYAFSRFASVAIDFTYQVQLIVNSLEEWLLNIGIVLPQLDELFEWIEIPAIAGFVVGQIPSVMGIAAMAVLIGTVLAFLGIEATQLPRRTRLLKEVQPRLYGALEVCAKRTRIFFGMTSVFAVIVGVLDTILLYIMDIPLAALWGLLAAICNFVPFLGFWIGLIPPALLALAIHGWGGFFIVIIAYLVLNFLITSVLPTKFVSDAVGLSMVVEVVSIVFWAWVLGPFGAILAIPLTLFAKAILIDANPNASWLGEIISSGKALRTADVANGPPDIHVAMPSD
jgi:predicted PurR-regulated permease PerM